MKLKHFYGLTPTTIELSFNEREQLAKSLKITIDYSLSDEEIDKKIQEEYDNQINRPEINEARRYKSHVDRNDEVKDEEGNTEKVINMIPDFTTERLLEERESVRETCKSLRIALGDNEEWINIVIDCGIYEEKVRDYAKRTGQDENAVSHKFRRAKEKLKKFYQERPISGAPTA